jgi:hypothetical protein
MHVIKDTLKSIVLAVPNEIIIYKYLSLLMVNEVKDAFKVEKHLTAIVTHD